MLRRVPVYKVSQYNVENAQYSGIVDDINSILEELEENKEDGIFPITLNREYDQGDTYLELHTEIIYAVRFGEFLGFIEYPVGLSVQLDDRYETVDVLMHSSYILPKITEAKMKYLGTQYLRNGTAYSVHAVNEEAYIEKMIRYIDIYGDSLKLNYEIPMLKAAADFKEHLMDSKYNQIIQMSSGSGDGLNNLSENPFEDMYYSNFGGDDPEPYIGRTIQEKEH